MKLQDITHVLCLSCVLMSFYVSPQPSCSPGWFGHQCKYKCRCDNESCDVNGSCIQPYTCKAWWFGPACQYVDIVYNTPNMAEITDGKDDTCNDPNAGDRISIVLRESIFFTWLRIHVTDQGSDTLRNLTVTFSFSTNPVPCSGWRKHAVSKTILDMHCNLSQTITEMTLTGPAVPHLCSVYVSKGRNVALKESAWQATTLTDIINNVSVAYDASKAVTGDSSIHLQDLSCTHTHNTTEWAVTLSRQRSVHSYVIYNRDVSQYRLVGFMLESFDSANRSVFVYRDTRSAYLYAYKLASSPQPVKMVVVSVNNTDKILTLCEVEIYGDSICDPQHYGRDCEHPCNCANNETCFVTTGACPSGCPPGFFGDTCTDACSVGTFGINCNESCNPNCAPSGQADVASCDYKTRICQTGCQSGFHGSMCTTVCSVGTFGANCNQSCSPNCESSGQAAVSSCDTKTGACVKGCQSGFLGDLCNKKCGAGTFGLNCTKSCSPNCAPSGQVCDTKTGTCNKGCKSGFTGDMCTKDSATNFLMEILLGLAGLLVLVFLVIFCLKRKKLQPAAEKTALNAQQGESRVK